MSRGTNMQPVASDTALDGEFISGKDYSYEQSVHDATEAWKSVKRSARSLGELLISIKKMEPHGRFIEALKNIGMPRQTALVYMQYTETVAKFPNDQASGHLTLEQAAIIRKLPPPAAAAVINTDAGTINGTPIAEAAKLTTNEFKRLVDPRAAEKAKARGEAKAKKVGMPANENLQEKLMAMSPKLFALLMRAIAHRGKFAEANLPTHWN